MDRLDRLLRGLFIGSLVFLGFVAGSLSAHFDLFPNALIKEAAEAASAWREREASVARGERQAAREQVVPVETVNLPGAYQGYTLYVSAGYSGARLLDMSGKEIYHWHQPFSKVWPKAPHVAHPLPDSRIYWDDAHVFPNGDILAMFAGTSDTPYGYGLAKFDKDSNVIWRYDANVHHRFDIAENGDIYILTHALVATGDDPELSLLAKKKKRVLKEWLVILSPDGKEKAKISITGAFLGSPYAALLTNHVESMKQSKIYWDFIHSNSVHVLSKEMAKAFPQFKAGQVLISFREFYAIGVLDLASQKITWATQGDWKFQHHARFAPDGSILLFDNRGGKKAGSRIIRYFPQSEKSEIAYGKTGDKRMFSRIRGAQQLLANGNILITESGTGRVFEATPDGNIVWDFTNPYRRKQKPVAIVIAKRYAADTLSFLNH